MMEKHVNEYDLHAYFDGELGAKRRAEVEAYLAEHPEMRAMLEDWDLQAHELRESFPEERVVHVARVERPRMAMWQSLAAAVVIAALGAGAGWGLRGVQQVPLMQVAPVEMAINAHATFVGDVIHPVEVRVEEEAHLLGWLTNRLGVDIKAPDLARAGYSLLGGRLLPDMGQNAGQFMYENRSGGRVTLYITPTPETAESAFRFLDLDGFQAFYWVDGDISYALVGQLGKDDLRRLAIDVYEQLI